MGAWRAAQPAGGWDSIQNGRQVGGRRCHSSATLATCSLTAGTTSWVLPSLLIWPLPATGCCHTGIRQPCTTTLLHLPQLAQHKNIRPRLLPGPLPTPAAGSPQPAPTKTDREANVLPLVPAVCTAARQCKHGCGHGDPDEHRRWAWLTGRDSNRCPLTTARHCSCTLHCPAPTVIWFLYSAASWNARLLPPPAKRVGRGVG